MEDIFLVIFFIPFMKPVNRSFAELGFKPPLLTSIFSDLR